MFLKKLLAAIATVAISAAGTSGAGENTPRPLKPEDLKRLRTILKPGEGEFHWAKIPWLSDLGEARKKAAAEGKPIMLWVAQGEPLGLG